MNYAEVLEQRTAEVWRKVQKLQQLQEHVKEDIRRREVEAEDLREEALKLQLKAEEQRQALKEQRCAKNDAGSLKKEADHREHQVKILSQDLAKHELETAKLIDLALGEAAQAASNADLYLELHRKAELEADLVKLRETEARNRSLEKEVRLLEEKIQHFPAKTGMVQVLTVLEDLRRSRKVAERNAALEPAERELQESFQRRVECQAQRLGDVEASAVAEREAMQQRQKVLEEESAQEEKDLREKLARNQRRADRAERELAKYKAAEAGKVDDQRSHCLPPVTGDALPNSNLRVSLSDFSVAGALKALDQELGVPERFGLLRPNL